MDFVQEEEEEEEDDDDDDDDDDGKESYLKITGSKGKSKGKDVPVLN
jgi:hypothetical protein